MADMSAELILPTRSDPIFPISVLILEMEEMGESTTGNVSKKVNVDHKCLNDHENTSQIKLNKGHEKSFFFGPDEHIRKGRVYACLKKRSVARNQRMRGFLFWTMHLPVTRFFSIIVHNILSG